MIELRQVTRTYGSVVAVDRLDLEIPRGEVFSFLGPNGAGKTTTVKMMVGLLHPTSGSVRMGGIDVVTHPVQANRMVGYVPDQPYLYDKLTGREFLEFTAELYGLDARTAQQNIAEQIAQFRLADFVDQLTERYSHGMKQRLVFAAALVHEPRILVVDEPMVGLDPRSMKSIKDLMRRQANAGVTIFMSTHTLPVAEEISDRLGIFHRGRLQFLGTVAELRSRLQDAHSPLEALYLQITGEST